MPTQRRTPYVSVHMTRAVHTALQRRTLELSAQVGRRISMSAVILAALAVADRHQDEFLAALDEA